MSGPEGSSYAIRTGGRWRNRDVVLVSENSAIAGIHGRRLTLRVIMRTERQLQQLYAGLWSPDLPQEHLRASLQRSIASANGWPAPLYLWSQDRTALDELGGVIESGRQFMKNRTRIFTLPSLKWD